MTDVDGNAAAHPVRAALAWLLALRARGSAAFPVAPSPSAATPGRITVLSPGSIPTTDFYFRSRVLDPAAWRWRDTLGTRPASAEFSDGGDVVIVRFAPREWLDAIVRARARIGRVVLFMDDDMPAAVRAPDLPLGYALRTSWRYHAVRARLAGLGAELWVSTPELATRFHPGDARVLEPLFIESGTDRPGPRSRYFYHGTWAHRREIAWLVPVVRAVQHEVPEAEFEVVGDARVRRLYAGIPRVNVRAPARWPEYRDLCDRERYGVGLAPCLESRFNAARSHAKFLDITRFGAVGVYAARPPYAAVVEHGRTGWLCDDRPESWVRAVIDALRGPAPLEPIYRAALAQCRRRRLAAQALA